MGSVAASIEFSSIPSGFAYFLAILMNIYGDSTDLQNLRLRFNGDSGNNYDTNRSANGAGANTVLAQNSMHVGVFGDTDGAIRKSNSLLNINNIATAEKIVEGHDINVFGGGASINQLDLYHLLSKWRNTTDEISTITFFPHAGNFAIGSRIILLGGRT